MIQKKTIYNTPREITKTCNNQIGFVSCIELSKNLFQILYDDEIKTTVKEQLANIRQKLKDAKHK